MTERFTSEELPPGFVMAITKLPSGKEAATIFQLKDPLVRVESAISLLKEIVDKGDVPWS
jgi:hypothetical protein